MSLLQTGGPPLRRASLNVIETEPQRRGPDRSVDRRLTFAGLVVAALFLVVAALSVALPPGVRLGWWLPVHLALAGGAATAIAAMLPFFVAALVVAPPAPAWLHGGAIALVASGAALAAVGRASDAAVPNLVPALGAVAFVAGAAGVAGSALWPLRRATGPRRPVTEAAYLAGLACVMAGVTIGGLYLAGEPAVVEAWARLRVAHAWLNAFGFLGLVIGGTLIHFAPTVAGARIRSRTSGRVAVAALGAGAVAGAGGYTVDSGGLVQAGAALLVGGAAALTWHGLRVQRDAVGWSSEHDWHRLASWSFLAAPAWLLVAAAVIALRVAGAGAGGEGWRLTDVAGPLIAGFAIQVLVGAMTNLVPAVGASGHAERAIARRALGRLGTARVVAWNLGTAALSVGLLGDAPIFATLATLGLVTLGIAAAAAAGALGSAILRR
ncbi:MAG TPA: hypothetical protein VFP56_11355 [Candidatus Limnocylindrales bacterium]|nr:hypothetical protein [Candidatus Limnocylindrales bacterium]